jgi:hypothetical protein
MSFNNADIDYLPATQANVAPLAATKTGGGETTTQPQYKARLNTPHTLPAATSLDPHAKSNFAAPSQSMLDASRLASKNFRARHRRPGVRAPKAGTRGEEAIGPARRPPQDVDGRGGKRGAAGGARASCDPIAKAHLRDGNPDAWRAAQRVVEHQLGKPAEQTELRQTMHVRAMTPEQRKAAIARMVEEHLGLAALIPRTRAVHPEP